MGLIFSMTGSLGKRFLNCLLALLLVSCTSPPGTAPPIPTKTKILPTNTVQPPTAIPSVTSTVTITREPTCDPFVVDFCITEGHLILQRPIQPPGNDRIDPVYGYGSTANGTREPHHGVEFSNPTGTPVQAAADGVVVFAGPDQQALYSPWPDFYGNLVVIEHRDQIFTLYAHLSKIEVKTNQSVAAGEQIGEVGQTGGAIGSHLHFEVRRGDVEDYFSTQNPVLWLVPARDETGSFFGALVISVVDGQGSLIPRANFTIGYDPDQTGSPSKIYYVSTYAPDMLDGEENASLGEMPPGQYRIAVEMNGRILERWVEVESGKLTQVVFVVK